jgi:hypothetical protein
MDIVKQYGQLADPKAHSITTRLGIMTFNCIHLLFQCVYPEYNLKISRLSLQRKYRSTTKLTYDQPWMKFKHSVSTALLSLPMICSSFERGLDLQTVLIGVRS